MNNSDVARVFDDIAGILEIKGEDKFKIRAYQRVARSIEQQSVELEQLLRENRLREVPGVGEAIAKKITELLTTGRLEFYEKLKAEFPEGLNDLMEIPGVGPRTALLLATELKVKSVDELEAAITDGKVAQLPRMGAKTAENILHQIQALRRKKSEQRIPLGRALTVVDEIMGHLQNIRGLKNLAAAGSLRRFRETIGDADLMGTADNPQEVIDAFTSLPMVRQVIGRGPTKASVLVSSGLKVDLRIVDHDSFGSLLQYFTGSKQHNVDLRERARHRGLSLSEYGITDLATGKLEKFATEEGFYRRQGLQYIPPEIREGQQEIALAERDALPQLVEVSDIKGDLHVHTEWSDGHESIETMALAAKALDYQYISICDHSGGQGVVRGMTYDRLREQAAEIEAVNGKIDGIRVLAGIEVAIRPDGSLDLEDELLAGRDIVIAGVHSSMNQPREQMTARIIKAMQNPNVDIIAHPTARLLPDREAVDVDMEAIIQAAARTGVALEINSMPNRLDLKDIHAYRARELGVKIVIDTDAHRGEHLQFMRFGVGVARRAWCRPRDILNTLPLEQFLAQLVSHRQV